MGDLAVDTLYRHPVKSMTPEPVNSISLLENGRVRGDRVLGFRFRNAGPATDWSWQTKNNFLGLVNTPGIARLAVEYDDGSRTLRVSTIDFDLACESIDDEAGRAALENAITDYAGSLDINPLTTHPERSPVVMVGDGRQPLFHDTAAGLVTLHSRASLTKLSEMTGATGLDGRRFRSNIVINGDLEPFEELGWVNRRVLIGKAEFRVEKQVPRCLVTHANPVSGERDVDVLGALTPSESKEKPMFAVVLRQIGESQEIVTGDRVEVIDQADQV